MVTYFLSFIITPCNFQWQRTFSFNSVLLKKCNKTDVEGVYHHQNNISKPNKVITYCCSFGIIIVPIENELL